MKILQFQGNDKDKVVQSYIVEGMIEGIDFGDKRVGQRQYWGIRLVVLNWRFVVFQIDFL